MEMSSVPRIAPGCRLHPTEDILLVPEGTLNLSGPSRQILSRLDGKLDLNAIVTDLVTEFDGADAEEVRQDVLGFLDRLQQRGVVRI
jgi:pyrroloquinoline quinone biosynthesis protein D